jgi:hypothetical protein
MKIKFRTRKKIRKMYRICADKWKECGGGDGKGRRGLSQNKNKEERQSESRFGGGG